MSKKHMEEEIMSGELLVVGKDMVQIELKKGIPDTVLVEFKNHKPHPHPHPCNPHGDKLEFEVHDRACGFVLVIKYNIAFPREIIWAVSFHNKNDRD